MLVVTRWMIGENAKVGEREKYKLNGYVLNGMWYEWIGPWRGLFFYILATTKACMGPTTFLKSATSRAWSCEILFL